MVLVVDVVVGCQFPVRLLWAGILLRVRAPRNKLRRRQGIHLLISRRRRVEVEILFWACLLLPYLVHIVCLVGLMDRA